MEGRISQIDFLMRHANICWRCTWILDIAFGVCPERVWAEAKGQTVIKVSLTRRVKTSEKELRDILEVEKLRLYLICFCHVVAELAMLTGKQCYCSSSPTPSPESQSIITIGIGEKGDIPLMTMRGVIDGCPLEPSSSKAIYLQIFACPSPRLMTADSTDSPELRRIFPPTRKNDVDRQYAIT